MKTLTNPTNKTEGFMIDLLNQANEKSTKNEYEILTDNGQYSLQSTCKGRITEIVELGSPDDITKRLQSVLTW